MIPSNISTHNPTTVFQLCWLRETSAGHLESDLGTAVPAHRLELALMGFLPRKAGEDGPSPQPVELSDVAAALESLERVQTLPKWLAWRIQSFFGPLNNDIKVDDARRRLQMLTAACDRIRAAADGRPWAELHLPYFTRRDWNKRFELLDEMRFEYRDGWVQPDTGVDPLALRETAMRVAAGVFHPQTEEEIPMRFRCTGDLDQPWASALAARWRMNCGTHPVTSIEIRIAGNPAETWRKAPRLHHGRHHQTWARVALQVQWILRRWAAVLQFSSPDGLEDVETGLQTMLFQALRPWAENVRSELSYDVLNEFFMATAFKKAANRLQGMIDEMSQLLAQRGQTELAKSYRGTNPAVQAVKVADRSLRGRAVRGMLSSEAGIVNALMRYSADVRNAQSPKDIRETVEILAKSFEEYLPRILRCNVPKYIGTAIFMEATAAMQAALGAEPTVDIRIGTADGEIFSNAAGYHAEANDLAA